MPTFTVHEPLRRNESAANPERFVFVRDGFHFWAFLLAPLWLLMRRLWLAFFIYAILNGAFAFGLSLLGVSSGWKFLAAFLVALAIGFEAASIWRWTLARRGWKTLGLVVGEDQEMAERRFYAAWTEAAEPPATPPAAPAYATPVRRGTPSGQDVIGLFPEPGGAR